MAEIGIDAELLFEEKRLRMTEMFDYNKRLDRIILLYITAVYSAIGLKFADKLDLSNLSTAENYSYLSFLFIFLNLSIVLHAISQASQAMSLAKFIHMGINKDIVRVLKTTKKMVPKYTLEWDNWHSELRIVAVGTRDAVVALWIILVLGISIFSLKIIDIESFYKKNEIEFWLIVLCLCSYLLYLMHNAILLMYFSSKYHSPSHEIQTPTRLIWISSFGITSIIILISILIVLSQQVLEIYTPLIQEFIARKEQILSLEIRLFIVTLLIQFIFIYIYTQYKKNVSKINTVISTLPFFFFLFEGMAINGKMGLVSNYLRQLENYLRRDGFSGLIWESKALEQIIFPVGNAFTLPATLAMFVIVIELYMVSMILINSILFKYPIRSRITGLILFLLILFIMIKSLTVDFHSQIPNVFE